MHIKHLLTSSAWGGLAIFSGVIVYLGIATLSDGWMSLSENIAAYPFNRWHYLAESLRSVCPETECTDVSPRTLGILASLHILTWIAIMIWSGSRFVRAIHTLQRGGR
jgi:hypothetical protein